MEKELKCMHRYSNCHANLFLYSSMIRCESMSSDYLSDGNDMKLEQFTFRCERRNFFDTHFVGCFKFLVLILAMKLN